MQSFLFLIKYLAGSQMPAPPHLVYAETWGPAPDQARIKYSIEESYTGQYATMIRKFDSIDNSSD